MPLSTSGSKSSALAYSIALAGICALLIIGFELSSVYLLKHQSLTYQRISRQYADGLRVRPSKPDEPPTVILVGNSLLLHGIEMDRFQSLTSTRMHVYPILLEATGYYDWLYGLRRLFREGARPQVVVVGVGVNYFLKDGVRQDYVPMLFFDTRDALAAASDMHLSRTETADLLLSHTSTFWDTRSAIRTQVLGHVVPHLEELFTVLTPKPGVPSGSNFDGDAVSRLKKLREVCEVNGAKLVFLVPPTLDSERAVIEMQRAAQEAGVDVSVPIDPATLSAKFYRADGMHLNNDGAVLFTSALAKDLPEKILLTNNTLAAGASKSSSLAAGY
jgi:hypothetical protein